MTNTITGTYTTRVTLSAAIDNPTTITQYGLLTDGLQMAYQGLTDDADLHLLVDGRRAGASFRGGRNYTFHLPGRPRQVVIASRCGAPQELGLSRDPGVLGVAIERLPLRKGARAVTMEAEDQRLCDGFHTFEPELALRWTNGWAEVPNALFDGFDGPVVLEIRVAATARYLSQSERKVRI
jgi:hypothetical protein